MPGYPYEPYDPMLAGAVRPSATPFQAYDPSVFQQAQQDTAMPAPGAGMNPNMSVGFEQPMNALPQGNEGSGMQGVGSPTQGFQGQQISPDQLAQLRALMQPGPMEQGFLAANAQQQPDVHGLRQKLAALGKGLLMGGIGGVGLAAFDPSMVNRAWHRSQLPGQAQAAQAEDAGKQAQLNRAKTIESLTGFDPNTGMRGPTALNRDYMNALAFGRLGQGQERIDTYKKNVDSQIESRNIRMDQIRQNAASTSMKDFIAAYNSGMLNKILRGEANPDMLYAMAAKAGIKPEEAMQTDPKILAGQIRTIVNSHYGVDTLNLQSGEVKPTGIVSDEATKEAGRNKRATESNVIRREGQSIQQQRLTDAEEKDIDKSVRDKHKLSRFQLQAAASGDADAIAARDANETAIEQEKQRLRAERLKQRGTGGQKSGPTVTAKDTGRTFQRKLSDGTIEKGVMKGIGPDGMVIIDWPSERRR